MNAMVAGLFFDLVVVSKCCIFISRTFFYFNWNSHGMI